MNFQFKSINIKGWYIAVFFITLTVFFTACGGSIGEDDGIPKSSNANLSGITLSEGSLNTPFSSSTTSYNASIPSAVNSVTVTGTTSDVNANVSSVTLSDLIVGIKQKAEITVTAEDNIHSNVYTVNIERAGDYNSANIGVLKYVPSGSFQRDSDAANVSTITSSYRISTTEINRAVYVAIMETSDPTNTSHSTGTTDPVQRVTWYDAIEFCNKLSIKELLTPFYTITERVPVSGYPITSATVTVTDWTANGYRLPTEMEWMWASIGATYDIRVGDIVNGVNTGGYTKSYAGSTEVGNNYINVRNYAWYSANSSDKTHPVKDATKTPNELGIYDMSGNVWEWCWDLYNNDPLLNNLVDYKGPSSGYARVVRGGAYGDNGPGVRVGFHYWSSMGSQYNGGGFRVVRN